MAESTSTLQAKLKALTHGKVDIMADADTFKNTTQILREMSAVWEEMTDIERAASLELMGGKRQANILSSLITNFETVEDVIETSMNSSGSAIAENEKWMDSIAGKSEKLTNAMQALWNDTLNSDMIKWFLDAALGAVELVDTIGMLPSVLAGVLIYFTAFKKQSPLTLFHDMAVQMQSYQQALYKLNALKKLDLNLGTTGNFNTAAVNAYAAAVSGLTAKKQAEVLVTSGLNKVQIEEVMRRAGVEDAVIKETLSKMNLTNASKILHTTTVQEAVATQLSSDAMQEKAVADFLAANGSKKLTAELLAQMVQQGLLTKEQAANIASTYALAGANNVASASFKTLGLAIKKAFLSNPVGWIMMIISGISMLVSSITRAKEEAIQAAEETVNKYKETQKTLRDQKETIDDLSSSYERLSKGVNLNTNENISLTTDSYKEYLDVCNDIADMYPHLVAGFDAQGNAILSLKGNVDQLIQAYKDAAQASRQEMLSKGGDIWDTFEETVFDNNKDDIAGTADGLAAQLDAAKRFIKAVNEETLNSETWTKIYEENENAMNAMFKAAGVSASDTKYHLPGVTNFEELLNDANVNKVLSFIKSVTNKINTETNKVKTLMDAYLGEDLDYAALSDKSRAYVDQIVSSFDAEFIKQFDSADELYNYIKTNIVDAFGDPDVTDAINSLSELNLDFSANKISYNDFTNQMIEIIGKIKNKVKPELLAQIEDIFGVDDTVSQAIQHVQSILKEEYVQAGKVSTLSKEDLLIAGQLEVPEGTLYSWGELKLAIEDAKIAATKDFDITNFTDAISAHSASISEYQEALQKLDKGSFTMDDFMELIKKYPELAKGVDISSNSFLGLARNLKGAIKTSTKDFVKQLKELRTSLVAAGKSTDSIDQLIEAIENMPDDALDNTIQKYSTLADKIDSARRAQDKLSASMEENPNEGYETRGEAMEYMKEAMKKGEIGSESNLWNVAEKYGFTYDSAKTINENADALAKFIATRERWFKEADDGDDRTDDGYSYEGTENFIKDVESAVQNNAELQKYLTWDYDESAGTLSFDYNNEDWDTIVSILSKTKQLAGLTSDEFSDMMIQIGQYFGIDWGNYDDVLSHLNKIATGTSDAKTKVEEYGKTMQDHFGDDTTIDLTARPMVKFDSTNFKKWEEYYQEIVNNPDGHSEADVNNAKEQLASIQKGDSYATVYSSTFSTEDGTKSIVVTPILPDGRVLSPEELKSYAEKLLAGEEIDPNIDIKLAEFDGENSIKQADEYAQALHEAQAEYDTLRDTLNINATIDDKGIEGLKEIKEVKSSIIEKADGTVVIDEEAFKGALTGAQYTEDQINIIIDKIKKLNKDAFNIDPFKIDETLTDKGVAGLEEIEKIKDTLTKDETTGLTVFDTDMFTSLLKEAGYTQDQIDGLIKKIQEYENIVSVSGNTDPLGLDVANNPIGNLNTNIDTLKASLTALGITYEDTLGTWFDGKRDLTVNVTDLVTTLKAKGWTDDSIKAYISKLSLSEGEGYTITVDGIDNIDEVIKTANEVPEEKTTEYEVTGAGITTLDGIDSKWAEVTKDKSTNYTITETTIKKTEEDGGAKWYNPFSWFANGTAHASGTAFSNGNWGAPKTETALTGELGPEILVRNGRWTTVGENGAEFTQVKKGDIIFNHKQSEELLKNGYVTGRGKAYASGTAYAVGSGTFARYEFSGSGGWQQYDVNDKVVESWGDLSGAVGKASKSASDAKDEFEETFDWVEVRLEEINEQLDLMNAQLENAGNYASKNSIIDQILGANTNKMSNLMSGIKKYSDYAARLLSSVPSQYREAAQDGAIAITEFVGEADEKTVEAIEKYREWAQKVADLKQQLEETKTTLRELATQKIDNAEHSGSVKATVEASQTEKLQNAVDYDEERGLITSSAYYTAMMENSNKTIEYLTAARNEMQKQFNDAVQSGALVRGSDEWYENLDKLYQIDAEIDEATIELEEFQNAINDIYWDNFDQLINRLDYLKEETQSLIDLMDSDDMVITPETDNGWSADQVEWTKEGMASLGLYAQQMEIAEYQSKQYAKAIDDLTADYKKGLYSENEYLERLNELKEAQYENIEAYYDAQDAIVDLNKTRIDAIKDGIEKEIDAYSELIEKKKEELDTEKDLYDFQKSVNEQSKNIADIQRKLAALSGDTSASAVAKRKQLEAELLEANTALEESYYDRSIENQQTALDKELEDFQNEKDAELEKWEEYLTNVELVVSESLGIVQANAEEIGNTLTNKAEEYNLTVSDAILSPWQDGSLAISDYQSTFDTAMSSTTDQLEALKNKWQEVIDKMAQVGNANVAAINKENANYAAATKKQPAKANNANANKKPATQTKAAPSVGGTVTVKKSATHFSSKSGNAKMASFVPGGSYTVYQVSGDQILIGRKGVYTGWVKKTDLQGYAKGTKGVNEDQFAWIDELGEELVMHADGSGKLAFLSKGSSVVPHDITENLIELGQLDPSDILNRNRPQIAPSKSVVNNNMEISVDASVGTLIHVDRLDGNNPDEITRIVNKAYDKKIQELNNSLKKFVR